MRRTKEFIKLTQEQNKDKVQQKDKITKISTYLENRREGQALEGSIYATLKLPQITSGEDPEQSKKKKQQEMKAELARLIE